MSVVGFTMRPSYKRHFPGFGQLRYKDPTGKEDVKKPELHSSLGATSLKKEDTKRKGETKGDITPLFDETLEMLSELTLSKEEREKKDSDFKEVKSSKRASKKKKGHVMDKTPVSKTPSKSSSKNPVNKKGDKKEDGKKEEKGGGKEDSKKDRETEPKKEGKPMVHLGQHKKMGGHSIKIGGNLDSLNPHLDPRKGGHFIRSASAYDNYY